MFDTLDQIDWSTLSHAYGPATDVPHLLRAIANTTDWDELDEIYETLGSSIVHQGTIYQATAYTVPFLIEIVRHSPPYRRNLALYILDVCAETYWYNDEDNHGTVWEQASYQAVGRYVPLYLRLLAARHEETRVTAASILSKYPNHASRTAPALRRLLKDSKPRAQIAAVNALSNLMKARKSTLTVDDCMSDTARFLKIVEHEAAHPQVRLTAANAYTYQTRTLHPAVRAVMEDAFAAPQKYDDGPRGSVRSHAIYHMRRALEELPSQDATALYLFGVRTVQPFDELWFYTVLLLNSVFGVTLQAVHRPYVHGAPYPTYIYQIRDDDQPRPALPVEKLTPLQRSALEVIAENDTFWTYDTNLLAILGLPTERDALRAYLRG